MAGAVSEARTLTSLIDKADEKKLLWFDFLIVKIQARLPLLLALLALIRDTFGETSSSTHCYTIEDSANKAYVNAYCTYRENIGILGHHEFIPVTLILQTVLLQIPVLAWTSFGGRKTLIVAALFAYYRKVCSETNSSVDEWKNYSKETMQSYLDEWSESRKYVIAYVVCQFILCVVTGVSLYFHVNMLIVTVEPHFLNHEFECYVETVNETVTCVKPYEIFNQILIIINIVICLAIPLIMILFRYLYLLCRGRQEGIGNISPSLKIPEGAIAFNDTNLLSMYYEESVGLDEEYVKKKFEEWITNDRRNKEIPPSA